MKIAIIINKQRAPAELITQLQQNILSSKYNIDYDLLLIEPEQIQQTLSQLNHQTYNAYLIGGGDGTVRSAIEILINEEIPLAILPLGTFNLLANTLNHPIDIEKSFEMLKNFKTKLIDIGEVNNKVFINHVWVGSYAYILKLRKQSNLGKNKILKMFFNIFTLFKDMPLYDLSFTVNNTKNSCKTYMAFISNNEAHLNLLNLGEHKSLHSGQLHLAILTCKSRLQLLTCLINILFGNIKNSKYYQELSTECLTITTKSNQSNVVIDGDIFRLNSPLNFKNHPKKLKVIIP